MKKILFALTCTAFAASMLGALFAVPFGVAFAGIVVLSILAGYAAKQTGNAAFETLAPELLTALETLKKEMSRDLTQSQKDLISKEIAAIESGKIKSLEDRIAFFEAERPKNEEREKQKQAEIDAMSAELKRFKDAGGPGAGAFGQSIQKQLEAAMTGKVKYFDERDGRFVEKSGAEMVAEKMLEIRNNNIKGFMPLFTIKAATDPILEINSRSGGTVGLTDFMTDYAAVIQRKPVLRQIVNVRPTSKMYVGWAEQNNIQGDAATTAEGTSKNQQSFETVERTEKVKKITLFDKTSKENLDDLPFMASEIRTLIVDAILRFLDSQIYSGNNSGENLKGLTSYAPAGDFSTSPLVNTITGANNYDVIRGLQAQIEVNGKGNFTPNYFLVNPWDMAAMDMAKTSEGVYVIPPFVSANGQQFSGMIGIANTLVTVDKILIGDFRYSNLALREDVTISMGYDGNDFTKNLVTMLGEMRALHYVKTNHVNAFAYGDFSLLKGQLDPTATSV